MKNIAFVNEILSRIRTEKPEIFKTIQKGAAVMGIACAIVTMGGAETFPIDERIATVCGYFLPFFIAVFMTGQLPNK